MFFQLLRFVFESDLAKAAFQQHSPIGFLCFGSGRADSQLAGGKGGIRPQIEIGDTDATAASKDSMELPCNRIFTIKQRKTALTEKNVERTGAKGKFFRVACDKRKKVLHG